VVALRDEDLERRLHQLRASLAPGHPAATRAGSGCVVLLCGHAGQRTRWPTASG
jgi:hypothetical protein